MTTHLTLDVDHRDDGAVVVTADGEIDMTNNGAFRHAVSDAVAQPHTGHVVIDFRRVQFIDSGTIEILFEYADHIELIANPMLTAVLDVSGITELVTIT
ncbi:STAS domain-containing protein [Nocardia sp. NPDC057668]|uniref:STAS domain-containing protein n=1 Tax=Nocardia sp. NPDC057668 TaxID=3346202 RepID=UPI00366C7EA6